MGLPAKRKRVKLRNGDILELSLPDGKFGYIVIVDQGKLPRGGAPYIAVFSSAYRDRPDLSVIAKDDVALAGWTTDAEVYHGNWAVIAHDFPVPPIPVPNFKVQQGDLFYVTDFRGKSIDLATPRERELLDYRFSRSPIGYQDAFEALHGFRQWHSDYDKLTPTHSRERMTRPLLRVA